MKLWNRLKAACLQNDATALKKEVENLLRRERPIDPELLLQVCEKTHQEKTLLHLAVEKGNPALVRLLLRIPWLDVNVCFGRTRLTALHLAVALPSVEIVTLLLDDERVDLLCEDARYHTPFTLACELIASHGHGTGIFDTFLRCPRDFGIKPAFCRSCLLTKLAAGKQTALLMALFRDPRFFAVPHWSTDSGWSDLYPCCDREVLFAWYQGWTRSGRTHTVIVSEDHIDLESLRFFNHIICEYPSAAKFKILAASGLINEEMVNRCHFLATFRAKSPEIRSSDPSFEPFLEALEADPLAVLDAARKEIEDENDTENGASFLALLVFHSDGFLPLKEDATAGRGRFFRVTARPPPGDADDSRQQSRR